MAIAIVTSFGALSSSSVVSVTFGGVAIPVGSLVCMGITNGSARTVTSVSDNSTQLGAANTYTVRPAWVNGSSRIQTAWCYTTRSILSTTVITATLSGTSTRTAGRLNAFSGTSSAGPTVVEVTGTTASPLVFAPLTPAATGMMGLTYVGWWGAATTSGAVGSAPWTATTSNSGGTTNRVEAIASVRGGLPVSPVGENVTFTSIITAAGEYWMIPPAGGTVFTQSLSASAGFSGALPQRQTGRRVTGSASFSGSVAKHPNARVLTGGFTPTGALSKTQSLARTLTAILRPTGTTNQQTNRQLPAATFTPTGTVASKLSFARTLTAAFTPTGTVGRLPAKVMTATLAPVASLAKTLALHQSFTAAFAPTTRTELGAIIPAYNYPSPTTVWDGWISGAPFVRMMIADPGSPGGPGTFTDTNYQAAFAHAQANGIRILGYVDTSYTAIPQATVTAQVDLWKSLYGINDIFFDQTSSSASDAAYYQAICDYVHLTGGAKVMLNPGTNADEAYMAMSDIICLFEGSQTDYDAYTPPSYVYAYAPSKVAHLVYDVPTATQMDADANKAIRSRAGYAYITDATLAAFPWATIPAYWTSEYAIPTTGFTKQTRRILTAALRPVGIVASSSRGAFTAAFKPTGTLSHGLPSRTLTAALSFIGTIPSRNITRLFIASLQAGGVLHTHYIPPEGPTPTGGGGYGRPMPDSFFTRYKPTLRRQR